MSDFKAKMRQIRFGRVRRTTRDGRMTDEYDDIPRSG